VLLQNKIKIVLRPANKGLTKTNPCVEVTGVKRIDIEVIFKVLVANILASVLIDEMTVQFPTVIPATTINTTKKLRKSLVRIVNFIKPL
jgi:hypothetical protein